VTGLPHLLHTFGLLLAIGFPSIALLVLALLYFGERGRRL
jgi:hypothetical protein